MGLESIGGAYGITYILWSLKGRQAGFCARIFALWFGASSAAAASGSSSTARYYNQLSEQISKITAQNKCVVCCSASQQMAFQRESAEVAMAFNREEAKKNRDWQQYMSDTAHQREIKDLQAAGLNPVLSAMGGNGAPVTSGATASG